MAEDFAEWLKTAVNKHANEVDKPVLVVGVTGKSEAGADKYGLIDELLEHTVFCGRYNEESLISVTFRIL
jgi:hypothetical protein